MRVELKVPEVGESVIEVQVGQWLKQQGDAVGRDDAVVEIESEKATVELPAPSAGVLVEVLKQEGDTAQVGEVIGYLESNGAESPQSGGDAAASPSAEQSSSSEAAAPTENAAADGEQRIMPAAQKAMHEHNVSADQVQATGPGGRILKEDVLRATEALQRPQPRPQASVPAPQPAQRKAPAPSKPAPSPAKLGQVGREDQVVPMTPIRRYIAQRLIEAQQTAALLTTFNEIDMTAVIELRKRYRDVFQEKYGIRLGFMSFFVKACVEALKLYPQINAEIRGTDIVYHNYYDVGIAVGSGKGLVVPIIRNAEYLNFAEVENTIADFGTRAQANKLEMEELKGGTFTISNGGVYGSLLSTPIVNPPQSGILGLHAIQERPMAHEGQVVIRPMMYVALTYDHRIVDGREAVSFLRHVKSCIEEPSRLLLEI